VTRCWRCARTFARAGVPNAQDACAHCAEPGNRISSFLLHPKEMLDLTHEERAAAARGLMRPAHSAFFGDSLVRQ